VLGVLFTVQAALVFAAIGWFTGSIGERLARHPAWPCRLQRLAGAVFLLLGLRLLLAD
jgi:threonine/homoserine/homoserine lactone efflux protein